MSFSLIKDASPDNITVSFSPHVFNPKPDLSVMMLRYGDVAVCVQILVEKNIAQSLSFYGLFDVVENVSQQRGKKY